MHGLGEVHITKGTGGNVRLLSVPEHKTVGSMSLASPSWTEQRICQRVRTLSPIRFEWLTAIGKFLRARGMTRDISGTGVYSYAEYPLPVGLDVSFDLLFPAELAGREPVMFHCQGRVLRNEQFHMRFGVALAISRHHLIDTAQFYRRSHKRVVPRSPVIACYAGSQAAVRNVSTIGAFIEDRHPLPVERKIRLRMQPEGQKAAIDVEEAIVRRVEPDIGMGVEFVVVTVDSRRQLKELARSGAGSE